MTHGHWFWFFLTVSSVVWYCTITIYVTFKGYADIWNMLRELRQQSDTAQGKEASDRLDR
jgi:hypothetical protein